jgi:hypothetical protein
MQRFSSHVPGQRNGSLKKRPAFSKLNPMPLFRVYCLFVALGLLVPLVASSTEPAGKLMISDSQQIEAFKANVAKLLQKQEFDELDKMVQECRSGKLRFPDGTWKLTAFYEALVQPAERMKEDDGIKCLALPDLLKAIGLLQIWRVNAPESITPRIALAHAYVNYAWLARGGRRLSDVPNETWERFKERLGRARQAMVEAEDLQPKDLAFFHAQLRIVIAENKERSYVEEIYEKGVEQDPSYYPFYANKAIYLLPTWSGEPKSWQRFANEAVELTHEKQGYTLYARIAWAVAQYNGLRPDLFSEYQISWPQMKKGFEDIVHAYPDSGLNLNWYCYFACLADDRDTARNLMPRIGNQWERQVWKNRPFFERWKEWALGTEESRTAGK